MKVGDVPTVLSRPILIVSACAPIAKTRQPTKARSTVGRIMTRLPQSPPRQSRFGGTRGGLAVLAQLHGDVAVLLRETEIAIARAGIADEFLKGAPFMTLPVRIIEILVEHQHRAVLETRRQGAQHGDGRGIDVAIDMQEGDALAR